MDYELMFRYISKTASPEEIIEFEEWLHASPANQEIFNEWSVFWNITEKVYKDYEPDTYKGWNEISARINKPVKRPKYFSIKVNHWYSLAASVILIVLLGIGWYILSQHFSIDSTKYLTYESGNDTLNILLKDGTEVSLNSKSILIVPKRFDRKERTVQLTGEAFFKVTDNTGLPFKVLSQPIVTEVIGTAFNVNSMGAEVRVTLLEGKVSFYKDDDPVNRLILAPGQHAVYYTHNGEIAKDSVSDMNNIYWKTRQLKFDQVSMEELCRVISEHYKTKVIFTNKDKYKGNFTGIIDHIDLKDAINIIELTMGGIQAVHYPDSILFLPLTEK